MALFNSKPAQEDKKKGGILHAFSVDVIKWEPETDAEASVIVHKFEAEDFPSGSQLIVHPAQIAVFINNLSAGNSLNDDGSGTSQIAIFQGPCKIKLETGDSRFAPFRNLSHALTGGESAYHSSVYFVNTTHMNDLNWGTRAPVVVEDPEEGINVHVRAFGLFGAHIEHTDTSISSVQVSKFLYKVVGTRADYTQDELVEFMRAKILEYVPDLLAKSIIERKIGVLKISAYLSDFSNEIRSKLSPHFDEFGLTLDNFSFNNINVPEEDLAEVNASKIQKKRNQVEAEGNAAKMDIESAARARMREREGYTYQQEQAYGVMKAAAQNEGGTGTLMGAGVGLGVGVGMGGVFGNGMANIAQNTMSAVQNQPQNTGNASSAAQNETIICPNCQAALPKEAKFCFNCGNKIENEIVCPDCGTKLVKGAKFCFNCGKKLNPLTVCPKCGAALNENSKFCGECGEKL